MRLYIIKDWIPYPDSAHGGLIVVAASDNDEAEQICRGMNASGHASRWHARVPVKVRTAKTFEIADSVAPGVVAEFRT